MRFPFPLIISVILFASVVFPQSKDRYGLEFIDQKGNSIETVLNLTPNKNIEANNLLRLEFDFSIIHISYGNVVLIQDHSNQITYNIVFFHHTNRDTAYFQLNINGRSTKVMIPVLKKTLYRNNWMTFRLEINRSSHILSASLNQNNSLIDSVFLRSPMNISISFGGFLQEKDTPEMIVRNVSLSADTSLSIHRWKLDEVEGEEARDDLGGIYANVLMPYWSAQDHYHWRLRANIMSPEDAAAAVNDTVITFPGKDGIVEYNMLASDRNIINYAEIRPSRAVSSILIGNTIGIFHCGGGQISVLHRDKRTWSAIDDRFDDDLHYYGHSILLDKRDQSVYMFGGYGWYKFSNLLQKFDFTRTKWDTMSFQNPQYFPRCNIVASPSSNGSYYLLSGQGNKTGKQQDGMTEIHDLWSLNLHPPSLAKICDFQLPQEVRGLTWPDGGHNLVVKADSQLFCIMKSKQDTIITSDTLQMFRLYSSRVDSLLLFQPVSDAILVKNGEALDGVYYNNLTNEFLILLTSALAGTDSMGCKLYTLSYPPLLHSEVHPPHRTSLVMGLVLTFIVSITSVTILFLIRDRNRRRNFLKAELGRGVHQHKEKPGIYLFGGLRIVAKTGRDITETFSPLSKQLLVLLILYSNHKHRVLTTQQLSLVLWPELDRSRAKNARGFALNKLRSSLSDVGDIAIKIVDGHWTILFGSKSYCEYQEYIHREANLRNRPSPETFAEYIEIISSGILTPELSYDWLAPIKVTGEEEVISLCLKATIQLDADKYRDLLIRISSAILIWDSVNEPAIILKTKSLAIQGRNGEANTAYNNFCTEYQKLHGNIYAKSFEQILESDPLNNNNRTVKEF